MERTASGRTFSPFSLLNGSTVGKYDDKDDRVDLRLRLSNQGRNRANMLQQVYVPSSREGNGQTLLVPLSQIAIRQYAAGSSDTRRYDRQKEIRLTANTVGTYMGQAVDAVSIRCPKSRCRMGALSAQPEY